VLRVNEAVAMRVRHVLVNECWCSVVVTKYFFKKFRNDYFFSARIL